MHAPSGRRRHFTRSNSRQSIRTIPWEIALNNTKGRERTKANNRNSDGSTFVVFPMKLSRPSAYLERPTYAASPNSHRPSSFCYRIENLLRFHAFDLSPWELHGLMRIPLPVITRRRPIAPVECRAYRVVADPVILCRFANRDVPPSIFHPDDARLRQIFRAKWATRPLVNSAIRRSLESLSAFLTCPNADYSGSTKKLVGGYFVFL